MRSLAHVEKIIWTRPIEGADKIELAGVLGWQCIVKKDEFRVGDLAVYIEIDSILPKDNPDFAFLEPRGYKIKTMKMRGVISQGILFPLSILHDDKQYKEGEDVTDALKISKVEDELPQRPCKKIDDIDMIKKLHRKLFANKTFRMLMRMKWFEKLIIRLLSPKIPDVAFPNWITKTDETRLQNMPFVLDVYKGKPMVVTEKIDGTSTTFGLRLNGKKQEFVVCSRNLKQISDKQKGWIDGNCYWEIANKYNIHDTLTALAAKYNATSIVLQGETIGEGIQGNKYKLKGIDFYAFNLIVDGRKIDSVEASSIVKDYGVKWVPILDPDFILLPTVDEMISYADGQSTICDTLREGVVIRDHGNTISFKCISNQFLLKHKL